MITKIITKFYRVIVTLYSTLFNLLLFRFLGVKTGKRFRSCGHIIIRNFAGKSGIEIGDFVSINSSARANPIGGQERTIICTGVKGKIVIGNFVGISNSALFSEQSIIIHDSVIIGANCKIYDTDFHSILANERLNKNINIKSKPVEINERAFIGAHSIILKGVEIGAEAVIASGSIVTKDIPSKEVWGGNPARFLKKIKTDY